MTLSRRASGAITRGCEFAVFQHCPVFANFCSATMCFSTARRVYTESFRIKVIETLR